MKTPPTLIPLGYAVGTGEPVSVPLAHTFVTGQTQASGKTTTLQAIVARSGRRALAFVTKRGEQLDGRAIRPYLPREGDREIHWRFVETIMASALGQRALKYERLQIINAAKGAKSLDDVRRNLTRLLGKAKANSPSAGIYELLGEYLDLVLPEMRRLRASHELDLRPGLNVMDLVDASADMQALAIGAAIGRVNEGEEGALTIFPEAWQFCLDDECEVLTPAGWKLGVELATGEPIACFDPVTEVCRFDPVDRVIVQQYAGPMVHLRGKWADALCTPDHRVVMRGFDHVTGLARPDWRFVAASDLGCQVVIPTPRPIDADGIPDLCDETLRVLGWVIAEGSWNGPTRRAISIEQSTRTRPMGIEVAEEMRRVLCRRGASVRERTRALTHDVGDGYRRSAEPRTSLSFYIGVDAASPIRAWLGDELHRIPRRILHEASASQLRELFRGLMEGDGTTNRGVWCTFYPGQNEGLADDFQELCTRLGIRCVKSWIAGQWRVSLSDRRDCWIRRSPTVAYSGRVWDVTVPGGAFVVRRNGRVFVTGNCPRDRNTAAKFEAEKTARMGAAIGNFLLCDSQDIVGVSPVIRQAASVWIVGVQGEANELKRTLEVVKGKVGTAPKAAEVSTLGLGQFFVCHGRTAIKTYVRPNWMTEDEACDRARRDDTSPAAGPIGISSSTPTASAARPILVAIDEPEETVPADGDDRGLPPILADDPDDERELGNLDDDLAEYARRARLHDKLAADTNVPATDPEPTPAASPADESEDEMSAAVEKKLDTLIELMNNKRSFDTPPAAGSGPVDEEAMYARFRARLLKEPAVLKVLAQQPAIEVSVERQTISVEGTTLAGRIARLIARGWLDDVRTNSEIVNELGRTGGKTMAPRVSEALAKLKGMGFVTDEGNGWAAVKGMKKSITEASR